jgi:hypothetical protein
VLAEFSSAVDAVQCEVAIQERLGKASDGVQRIGDSGAAV